MPIVDSDATMHGISIPGPKGEKLLERRNQSVPRGVSNTIPTFAAEAKGALLTDVDGNTFIDFAGAIGTLNVGHAPTQVVNAVKDQLEKFIHPGFNVMMYESYIELAERLNELTPGSQPKKTLFLNSGAEAVENAVKIARKYTGRKGIVSFERGFHGRTLLAMSLTSKVKPYKYQFGPFAPETYKMKYPYYYRADAGVTEKQLDEQLLAQFRDFFISEAAPEDVAAVIFEPVQGEGGFVIPSKTFVQGVKQLCEEYGILFIADEIQTGFGRTGKLFAMEHFEVIPDLVTMSKSLAAGFPLSAVTGRAEIMDAPNSGEIGGTYGGSPVGCVAALEVIQMMTDQKLPQRAQAIGATILLRFREMQEKYTVIGDVRGLGAMCAMEIVKDRETKEPDKALTASIIQSCYEHGVMVLSAGLYSNVVRILCPLVISDEELDEGLDAMDQAIAAVLK